MTDRRTRVAGAAIVSTAWAVLGALSLAGVHEHVSHDVIFGDHGVTFADIAVFCGLWTLMVIAMMLPAALVSGATGSQWSGATASLLNTVAANTTVWGLFGLGLLTADGVVHRFAHSVPVLVDAVLPTAALAVAGLYQLMPAKRRFQSAARLACGAWQHTFTCLGSCWALMTVMFALGTGGLLWMAVLSAVMLVEQLPRFGDRAATAGGIGLVSAGVLVAAV
jgi:predicted metal-binding membrane protein